MSSIEETMSSPAAAAIADLSSKKKQDELDSFLTTIESKLRGPFSSLDLAKAVSTAALRSSSSSLVKTSPSRSNSSSATNAAKDYLHNLLSVFSRTDKVIQCRMLIGLMGLEDNSNNISNNESSNHQNGHSVSLLTPDILEILKETQKGPLHEEWVRTTSGLIQGIMFRDASDDYNTRGSCRGEEASDIIFKQQQEVAEKLLSYLEHHHTDHDSSKDHDKNSNGNTTTTAAEPDLNACFAPYRYSLISTAVLNTIIPELQIENSETNNGDIHQNLGQNCHFHVNVNADILQLDWKLEEQRAEEEEQHGGTGTAGLAGITGNAKDALNGDVAAGSGLTNLPPGFRPTKLVNSPKSASAKSGSNLFMPKTKSTSLFNTGSKGPGAAKTLLRRKGGAQALVKGSSMKQRMAAAAASGRTVPTASATGAVRKPGLGTSTTATTLGARGVGRFTGAKGRSAMAAGRSKMKMIDVQEVSELTKQHQEEEVNNNSRASKRKRILETAQKSMTGKNKKPKNVETAAKAAPPPPAPVAKAQIPAPTSNEAPPPAPAPPAKWELALGLPGTNKMSDDDRLRVEKFVGRQHNPTPNQSMYKMKIHEQRGTDPNTGEGVKETYYLELQYNDFSHKMTKKLKRY